MADSKITKKHHPSGSFSRRILAVTILLLVIPLFLQSLFLYREEYKQKLEDVTIDLDLLAKERVHFIQEIIQSDWQLLDVVSGGPYANVKQLYIERIPMPQGLEDRFVLVKKTREALLVGKRESSTHALVIPISFSLLAKELPSSDPIRLSLLDLKGKVVWENIKLKVPPDELVEVKEPIGGTGLIFQLSMEKNLIHGLHLQTYYLHFATLVFFVGVIGGGAVYLFTRRISRPLKNLCKTMERVSEGSLHSRYTPDRMGFEINELGLQFNQTLDDLLRHAQLAERERIHREKLAEELRIGHDIQASLLPSHVPGLPNVDIATAYLASKEVNGDFYDLFRLENGNLLIAMCDTAGKGISACLFSLGLRSIIRSLANVTTDVADLVRRANDLYMIDAHDSSMFSTLWLGIYNPNNHHLEYCSQGHPPAVLRRGSQIEELWTGGIALGAQKIDVIPTKKVTLGSGDLLLLYTDGVTEAHDPDGQLFGKTRLNEWVLRKKRQTAQQIADQLVEEIHLFSQGTRQHDDISLIVIRIDVSSMT
jgi:serine phosphatase RsbU (regulator of sigma subunit)